MRIHFISIGGVAMHNLAIALHLNGNQISGSDDGIFEPSYSRLKKYGLLPDAIGWFPEKITEEIDEIIVGMHALHDNPELKEAQIKQIPIYSYPEFLYEYSKDKIRIVIAGSHGKTTITSMIIHVLKHAGIDADFIVGAPSEGFDLLVKLNKFAKYIIIEGDEYPSSPMDQRSKFLHYNPHIAVISGISWDHADKYPTFENYLKQFRLFLQSIEPLGCLFYYQNDDEIKKIVEDLIIRKKPYKAHPHKIEKGITNIYRDNKNSIKLNIFGLHNMANLNAARMVCKELGVIDDVFYKAISCYKSVSRRLELLEAKENSFIYRDFAHSPSKLKAAVTALRIQYPEHRLIICYELHSDSSMSETFIDHYSGTLDQADDAIVFYNPNAALYKKIPLMTYNSIKQGFSRDDIQLFSDHEEMLTYLRKLKKKNHVFAFLTSGRFGYVDYKTITLNFLSS